MPEISLDSSKLTPQQLKFFKSESLDQEQVSNINTVATGLMADLLERLADNRSPLPEAKLKELLSDIKFNLQSVLKCNDLKSFETSGLANSISVVELLGSGSPGDPSLINKAKSILGLSGREKQPSQSENAGSPVLPLGNAAPASAPAPAPAPAPAAPLPTDMNRSPNDENRPSQPDQRESEKQADGGQSNPSASDAPSSTPSKKSSDVPGKESVRDWFIRGLREAMERNQQVR